MTTMRSSSAATRSRAPRSTAFSATPGRLRSRSSACTTSSIRRETTMSRSVMGPRRAWITVSVGASSSSRANARRA
ncbi:hypothetical protein NKG05_18090 [Oerskovia sp. M15]